MKSIIAAGALFAVSAPAIAGPYANVENNAAWSGGDYSTAVTEVHAGWELPAGESAVIYLQGGPAFIHTEDVGTETEYSGKVGVSADVSEQVNLYGEVGFLTVDQEFDFNEMNVGTKVGVTYRF